ncbi:MAG: nicotinamide riboside transporter PnuC [Porticoccaceae bacterium]
MAEAISQTSLWEWLAVISSLAYLLLAMRENNLCWYFAFASTLIYTLLFWDVSLLMDSALNVYYMGMAIYGWWYWQRGGASSDEARNKKGGGASRSGAQSDKGSEGLRKVNDKPQIRRWRLAHHGFAATGIVLLSILSGYLLAGYTDAAWPYVDSFTTWASVLTTWMVAQKILENWLYWLVIDSVSLVLYVDRELYLTAVLFAAYVIIVVFGFFNWLKRYRENQAQYDE